MSGILGYLRISGRFSGVLKEFLTDLGGTQGFRKEPAAGGFFEDFRLKTIEKLFKFCKVQPCLVFRNVKNFVTVDRVCIIFYTPFLKIFTLSPL